MSKLGGKVFSEDTDKDAVGQVDSVVAGTNVTVNNSDPANPVVSSTATASPTTTQGDLIKRGASVDERLPVGSALEVLRVNGAGDDLEFAAPAASTPTTTEGDVIQRGASADERLAIGTANQILAVNSGATALEYVTPSAGGGDPLTTKGDLFGFDTDAERIPVGTNGQVLEADSTQALGVKWATPAAAAAAGERFETSNTAFSYSGSSNATKGASFNCINNITVQSVNVWVSTDASATYKLVIAEVSGGTDVIDAITGTSDTVAATSAINPVRKLVFASPVSLVSGKRYAFLMVRTDGSGTAICRASYATVLISDENLTYASGCIEPTNEPATAQAVNLDTANTVHMIINYTVD